MTSPNVSTSTTGMRQAGDRFVSTYDELKGYMQHLKGELTHLRTQWDGEAAKVFEQTMDLWGAKFDSIQMHLDAMADLLKGGAGHYTSAEDFAMDHGHFFKS